MKEDGIGLWTLAFMSGKAKVDCLGHFRFNYNFNCSAVTTVKLIKTEYNSWIDQSIGKPQFVYPNIHLTDWLDTENSCGRVHINITHSVKDKELTELFGKREVFMTRLRIHIISYHNTRFTLLQKMRKIYRILMCSFHLRNFLFKIHIYPFSFRLRRSLFYLDLGK